MTKRKIPAAPPRSTPEGCDAAFAAEARSPEIHYALQTFLLRRTKSRYDAEDLVQEVYLRLLERDPAMHIRDWKSFMFAVAVNLLRDRFRRTRIRSRLSTLEEQTLNEQQASDPYRAVATAEALQATVTTIESLKRTTREAFLKYRLQGLSHSDIAVEMGISSSMVEKHVSAAMAALTGVRSQFSDEWRDGRPARHNRNAL